MSERLWRMRRALEVVTERPPVAMTAAPLQLRNPLNGSGGTTKGARYAANARRVRERAAGRALAMRLATDLHGWTPILTPRVVVLTRVSPKAFDSDNLAAALKSIRDGMAETWGIDDADPRVTWVTDWRKGKTHEVEASLWVLSVAQSDDEVDASDYERPRRQEPRATPAAIRARGGA